MRTSRRLRKATGVILIVVLASGALAATKSLDKTDLMRGRETMGFPFNLIEDGYVEAGKGELPVKHRSIGGKRGYQNRICGGLYETDQPQA
jgi:hypothetical protein